MYLFDPRGARLVLGDLRCRVELRIGQLVGRELLAPVVRDKDRVRAYRLDDERGKHAVAPTRDDLHALAVADAELLCRVGVYLDVRLGTLLYEKADAAC